jgi:predicted membrane-bound spermidine synthase
MIRWTALLLTVLTGFSGLTYEVAWEKYLATLVGSHAEATASVLGIFLGGLSLGYWVFGRVTGRIINRALERGRTPRLLFGYGVVEASIGAWVLLFPFFFDGVQALSLFLLHGGGGVGFAADVRLCVLLIGPPTVLMGGTIPFLTQALPRSLDDATRTHALVYGCNTAGAFVGALCAGFVLIPRLGLATVMWAMGSINLIAGALFVLLGWLHRSGAVSAHATREEGPALDRLAGYAAIALLVGFAMMTLQAVLNRIGALALGSSPFTFSMVVAVFVACIAIGSLAVSALPRIPRQTLPASLWALFLILCFLYGTLENAPYWALRVRALFSREDADFHPFHLAAFASLFALIGPAVVLSGATLPLIFHRIRDRVGELGAAAGSLYAWNTLGSLLGALIGGYVLLFFLDLHHVYRIALAALTVAAVWATIETSRAARAPMTALLLVPTLSALALLPAWRPERLSAGLFRKTTAVYVGSKGPDAVFEERAKVMGEVISYEDDPTASIAVFENPAPGRRSRSLYTNGKSEGATQGDVVTFVLSGLIPELLAERVERAFVIGFGTGLTVGALADLDDTRVVDVAEISPAVVRAAPLFDSANHAASKHPKVRIVRSDAYRALRRSPDRYDVIASEPSNPWVAGIELLYSQEFLRAARERLRPGGVYGQWIHYYEMDDETLELVLRTFNSVFESVAVWNLLSGDLLILGLEDEASGLDLDRIERRAARPDFARGLRRARIQSFPALLAHELWPIGVAHVAVEDGPLHTLHHPRLAYLAGRAFFRADSGRLPFSGFGQAARIGASNSLLGRLAARSGGHLPEDAQAQAVKETCLYRPRECVALLGRWRSASSDSLPLRRLMRWVSNRSPNFRARLEPQALDELAVLYGGAMPAGSTTVDTDAADGMTDRFASYYHHAAPFDPDALLALWDRCRETPSTGACDAGRDRAHRLLRDGSE